MVLTVLEREVLEQLALRPNGGIVRDPALKRATIELAGRVLVCDPHQMGEALFTRITDAGRAALAEEQPHD